MGRYLERPILLLLSRLVSALRLTGGVATWAGMWGHQTKYALSPTLTTVKPARFEVSIQ